MQKWLVFTAIICLFLACRHLPELDDYTFQYTIPANNSDTLFPLFPCGAVTYYPTVDRYRYYYGCFNPVSNNEIAFVRHDMSVLPRRSELCIFNFSTGAFHMLASPCSSPSWSKKGWIAFTGKNGKLWMIKSNGDSLTQLTLTGGGHLYPRWDARGERIMFYESGTPNFQYMIINTDGERLDTINNHSNDIFTWDGKNIISSNLSFHNNIPTNHISLRDAQGVFMNYLERIVSSSHDSLINSIDFSPLDKEVYWTNFRQVNSTHFSGRRRQIAQIVNNNLYGHVSVSGSGTKLIIERVDVTRLDLCTIEERFHLYLMEADGTGERKILFPE